MKIGLAYAMGGEIESILQSTNAKLLETVCGVPFYEIEEGIIAYAGGVGKVNAAMSTQLFIDRYQPDWVLNAGVAGSFLDVPIGMVSTVNRIEFPTDSVETISGYLRDLGVEHLTGKVATGEIFMTKGERCSWVAKTFSPTLCEMEGGAIAQVCLRNGVKYTALKSVSDRLCNDNNADEFFNFGEAMAKLNTIVLPVARAIRDEK